MMMWCERCSEPTVDGPCLRCGSVSSGREVAERRQLTVLFCDLVASVALSGRLDPEDLRDVIHSYQEVCGAIISRFEGYVAQYLGDGILAYFGYPMAHEDDAQRAVTVALNILAAIPNLNPCGERLQVRIGIHSGLVVVGLPDAQAARSPLAIGETPNIAHRAQTSAAPGTVVITEATHRLVSGLFRVKALGSTLLSGRTIPMPLYHVAGESGAVTRLQAAPAAHLTPYLGRDREIAGLIKTWALAQETVGGVVVIGGEPGIGKSRLVEHAKRLIDPARPFIADCHCSPYHRNSAFFPFIGFFRRHFRLDTAVSDNAGLSRLEEAMAALPYSADASMERTALMATLLSLPAPKRFGPLALAMTPQKQRQRIMETIVEWFAATALAKPLLLIMEDLHWADPSTIELVHTIVKRPPAKAWLTVLTHRPDFVPSWGEPSHLATIGLDRLSDDQVRRMAALVARKQLPDEILDRIAKRSEGVPLFVEEVTKAVLESGSLTEREDRYELSNGHRSTNAIPDTIQGSLMARLDGLGASKQVAQLAATLGRESRYDVLREVSRLDDEQLRVHLSRIVAAGLMIEEGSSAVPSYKFKHSMIRDTAYESVLRRTRQQYHRQTADTLRDQFPELAERHPELLAIHFEGGGLIAEAVACWMTAGQRALGRAANIEAAAHLGRALELLEKLPPSRERDQQELHLQLGLGPAYMATKGWQAPEVNEACQRAFELCRQSGESDVTFRALWGLWAHYFVGGDRQRAVETARRVLEMATRVGTPMNHQLAHHAMGFTLFFEGDLAGALGHAEAGERFFDLERERVIAAVVQMSSMQALQFIGACSLWLLGLVDSAVEKADQMMTLAQNLAHAPALAAAAANASWLHCFRRDWARTRQLAERALSLAREHGFFLWIPVETVFLGRALAGQGRAEEGLSHMREGIHQYGAMTPHGLLLGQMNGMLAEVLWTSGQSDEALRILDEGIANVDQSGWRYAEPELHRLKGEILCSQDDCGRGEGSLRTAVQVARHLGARTLELRAMVSLSRFLAQDGRHRSTHDELAYSVSLFTEGREECDLRDAFVLLNHQAQTPRVR